MCLFFQVTLLEVHQLKLQLELTLPWMTSCKLQTGVQSQCSEGSTTDPSYGRTVLSSSGTGETWPSVCFPLVLLCVNTMKWLDFTHDSYKQHHWYVRLSLLKYDCQMAQIMQWLHAIWDYMKKVKSSISMVPPTLPITNGSLIHRLKVWSVVGIHRVFICACAK